jgi:hypothetical protein
MATVESTDQLIEYYLTAAKEAKDISTLANAVASVANLELYMNHTQHMVWRVLCQRFQDWRRNLETGK